MATTFNQPSTDIIQSGDNIGLLKKAFSETPTTIQPVENYNIPKSFDASTLNNITTPVVPQTLTPPATDAFVKSLEASNKQIQDLVASYNQPTDQLATEQTGLFAKLQETIAKQGTQGTRLTEEQAKLQVPENITKLQDINTQITQKMNEYNARVAALPGQGRGITTGIIQGQTDREKRLAATEIGALSSIAQTLQGNIALAQQTAKDTVDAEFAPYETEIKQLQTLIEANKDRMTTAEKRRAEQVQITLDERARLLGEQKTERNNVIALAQEAAKNGADNTTINNILKTTSSSEALTFASPFIGKLDRETAELDKQYKVAQIANIRSEIANRGLASSGADASSILAYAQQYAASGQIPTGLPKGSFGLVSQVAKELPKPTGTLVDMNTGIKPTKLNEAQMTGITSLYDVLNKAKELKELDKSRIGGVIPGITGKIFGSKSQANYIYTRSEIVDLLARARSGAALTENEVTQYEKKLPGRFSEPLFLGTDSQVAIDNFIKSINSSLNSKLQLNGLSIYGYTAKKIGDEEYKVGDIVTNGTQNARVNPDGTLTLIQ